MSVKMLGLISCCCFIITSVYMQNHFLTFSASGLSGDGDSVQVLNLSKNIRTTVYNGDTLELVRNTNIKSENKEKGLLSIYPNPIDDILFVEFLNSVSVINI